MKVLQLDTPALIADETIMNRNMRTMAELLKGKKLQLRPHFKSNKCTVIAHRQIELGAVGITCAKLSEAEDLCDSGIEDILIANQIVDPAKITRMMLLAKKCRLTVCVDDEENAGQLSEAAVANGAVLYCLAEYEIGMERCGVTDADAYVRLAKRIDSLPNLEYQGIQAYAGHVSHMISEAERKRYTEENGAKLRALIAKLEKEGLQVKTVSGGSTGTSLLKAEEGLYTELQAGSYFFMDSTYNKLGLPFENSLFLLATVVSKRPGLTILDAGVKSIGVDQDDPEIFRMNGTKVEARVETNEEHMKLFGPSAELEIGEKVKIIPGHCCSTVNLHKKIYLFKDGKVTDRLPVTARGKSV